MDDGIRMDLVDWIHVSLGTVQWRVILDIVMNLWCP